ncbi:MAG: hypothetical protein HGA78_07230 [Nitrospirales bacterium]|nr:hypothetical protein [Nitrospirales bacterium]
MEIERIMKEGLGVLQKNPAICLPTIFLNIVFFFFVSVFLVLKGPEAIAMYENMISFEKSPDAKDIMVLDFFYIFSIIAGLFVYGLTVGMAQKAIETGSANLREGIKIAKGRFFPLLSAAVLFVLTTVGLMLLVSFPSMLLASAGAGSPLLSFGLSVIAGLMALYLLMFAVVAVVVDGLSAAQGMKRSLEIVMAHKGESFFIFSILALIVVILFFSSIALSFIPFIGQATQILVSGIAGGFVSVVLVMVYKEVMRSGIVE